MPELVIGNKEFGIRPYEKILQLSAQFLIPLSILSGEIGSGGLASEKWEPVPHLCGMKKITE
jgi:hypothetical protein